MSGTVLGLRTEQLNVCNPQTKHIASFGDNFKDLNSRVPGSLLQAGRPQSPFPMIFFFLSSFK